MFTSSNVGLSGRQAKTLAVSLALHGLLLGWLLYSPPRFLAPSSVAAGEYGGVTRLYWPSHQYGNSADAAAPSSATSRQSAAQRKLEWKKAHRLGKTRLPAILPLPSDAETQANSSASASNPAPPAGLPYGTSAGGSMSGDEIRPALPL